MPPQRTRLQRKTSPSPPTPPTATPNVAEARGDPERPAAQIAASKLSAGRDIVLTINQLYSVARHSNPGLLWIAGAIALTLVLASVFFVSRKHYVIDQMHDEVDFSEWREVTAIAHQSPVHRRVSMRLVPPLDESDYGDTHGTTGTEVTCDSAISPLTCDKNKHKVNPRLTDEVKIACMRRRLPLLSAVAIGYAITYWDSYKTSDDDWVTRNFPYGCDSYALDLRFPATRKWRTVTVTKTNSTHPTTTILQESSNADGGVLFHFEADNLHPNDSLLAHFQW